MTWFKVDDGFHSHPKTIAAGNAAIGLWTRCGSHCSSYTTNGFVPKNIAKAFGTPAQVQRLLEVGLWREVSGGYQMHDFLDFNPTAEKVLADRAEAAERKRRWREQHRQSVTEVSRPGHAVTSASVTDLSHLPRPDPTRPDPLTSRSLTTSNSDTRQPGTEDDPNGPTPPNFNPYKAATA
jgi:hypothetical protein